MNLSSNQSFREFMSDRQETFHELPGAFNQCSMQQVRYLMSRYPIDYICITANRSCQLENFRLQLGQEYKSVKVLANIQSNQQLKNYEELLRKADGVKIVNRNLDAEIEAQMVRQSQHYMIEKANL